MSAPLYTVAVRALCEFTAKVGDLDLRFTPAPTAQEGIAGHTLVAARRAPGYQAEVSLSGDYQLLRVRGRADGYDAAQNRLEEVKTFKGDLTRMPDNQRQLHWAQLKIYGWLLCRARDLSSVALALIYFDIGSQQETVLCEQHSAASLHLFFEDQCQRFLAWAEQELVHREQRDRQLAALPFPHAAFRIGQRALAAAVYQAASSGCCLMAQAPTGIGKTIGTLFPLLKACPGQQIDKIFYLAAKTSGRGLALEALHLIQRSAPALPLRVVELVARDKACEYPDKACHGDSCPLAKGFYDRLPAARTAAVALGTLDKSTLRTVALAHQVCPYYLSQDLVRWADVVVGDYNYYFDISAMLYSLTLINQWRIGVLVDEAHNMIERGRKMYSAELEQGNFNFMRRHAPAALKKPLARVNRHWNEIHQDQTLPYQAYPETPAKLLNALQAATSAISDHMMEHPANIDTQLQRFYFDALNFCRVAELFDQNFIFDVSKNVGKTPNSASPSSENDAVLCLRNIIPAPFLKARFAATRSTTLFSATLRPWHFYNDILGLPANTAWVDVPSPFASDQLAVHIMHRISTRYRDRQTSLAPIVDLIARQYQRQPGNYLAFFSSFDYLQQVTALFRRRYPALPLWEQARRMDEAERDQFLARFTPASQGIGFAVLGGSFGEGIDLPGKRLVGAFIATLGLPQINPVNEEIRKRIGANFGNGDREYGSECDGDHDGDNRSDNHSDYNCGYDYTYLYPGLQKVVQAAGRVIRSQSDSGVVYLIDDRFTHAEVRALLPDWWQITDCPASTSPAPTINAVV
jgi:DNA excision repair protein ERCC-2